MHSLQTELLGLEKVKQLSKDSESLKKKAGKISKELDDLVRSFQDLNSELEVLSSPVIENQEIAKLPEDALASVKAASLVFR